MVTARDFGSRILGSSPSSPTTTIKENIYMNGKKARKLRKQARALATGPETYIKCGDGSIQVNPSSSKGLYRKLKKEYLERKRTTYGNR